MKKVLLILAIMLAVICAKAQDKGVYYSADTLTYQQLMADYVSLNNQMIQFRNYELASVGLGIGSAALATGAYFMAKNDEKTAQVLLITAGAAGLASAITYIVGYTKIKRNRLEITPNGVVIKLTPYE